MEYRVARHDFVEFFAKNRYRLRFLRLIESPIVERVKDGDVGNGIQFQRLLSEPSCNVLGPSLHNATAHEGNYASPTHTERQEGERLPSQCSLTLTFDPLG
jgi:hypothetical protein